MQEIDDLKKAISLVEQAANILLKSQMSFDFSVSNPHDHHVAYTRTNASGTVSNISAKGAPKQLPTNWKDAHDHAEKASDEAWNGEESQEAHDKAEAALVHSEKLHRAAAAAASDNGDLNAMQHHKRKAEAHAKMAEEHGARSHQMWVNQQQAKQVAAIDKPATTSMTEADAGTHLKNVADANDIRMYRKAAEWDETNATISSPYKTKERHEINAEHFKGTEARHYTMQQVYGHNYAKPGYHEFTDEFMEKQRDAAHDPFVMTHPNGNKYLIDPQGGNYARYIAKVKGNIPKSTPAATGDAPHRIGDTVHLGFGTKGGAGIVGKLTKIEDGMAHITNDEGRTFKGHVSKLSASGTTAEPPASQKPSKVHVDTSSHFNSHLKEPKGRGGWMFSKDKDIDFGTHKRGEDWISTPSMTYADAKKHAKEWAASKGHSTIYVMP